MRITYGGLRSDGLEFVFGTDGPLDILEIGPTALVVTNTLNTQQITIAGKNLTYDVNNDLIGGTVLGLEVLDPGIFDAAISDGAWPIADFTAALSDYLENTNFEPLRQLIGAGVPITVDASALSVSFQSSDFLLGMLQRPEGYSFTGSDQDDLIPNSPGNDSIQGGAGTDTYIAGATRAQVLVIDRGDSIRLEYPDFSYDDLTGVELVQFTDQTVSTELLLIIPGEQILGDNGNNFLNGTGGNDTVIGARGDDTVIASAGDDDVRGDGGDDRILGENGNDTLRGGRQNDTILGGEGDDVIRGQRDADTLYGGAGLDNVKGGGGSDLIYGEAGNDFLKGGTRQDTVEGGTGHDIISGNSFDDSLSGGGGNDTIRGGGGNDTLTGDWDDDVLKGGAGSDVFFFESGFDHDRILDFDMGADSLQFGPILASGLSIDDIVEMAEIVNGALILEFGGGGRVQLDGITSTDGLSDALIL